LITIKRLNREDYKLFNELILVEGNNFEEFLKLGWSVSQIKNQLNKKVDLSYGAFYENILISFILGDLINIEKLLEYEILFIYVCKKFRNIGIGTKLLKKIEGIKNSTCLKKIYLEVSEHNRNAKSFYIKMNFKKIYTRKNYYTIDKEKIDAEVFSKTI